jgi:C4-dicarboxylate-specific signal transduction histidine kinase
MVPITAFATFAVFAVLNGYRAAEEARLRDVSHALALAVDNQLGSSLLALRVLASSSLLDASPFDAELFEAHARRIGEETGGWVVLQGPPPDYVTLANARRRPGARIPAGRSPEVTAAIEKPLRVVFGQGNTAVSNLFRGPVVQDLVLAAFVPVIRDERVTHALSIGLEPRLFRELLVQQGLRDRTFAFVVDGNHRVIANSLETGRVRVGTSVPAWMIPELEAARRTVLVGRNLIGQDTIYSVAKVNLAPDWRVIAARPVEAVNAAAWRSARWLPLGGVALVVGTGLLVWVSRRETLLAARREAAALRAGRAEVERLHAGVPTVIFLRDVAPDGSSRPVYRSGDLETVMGWPAADLAARRNFEGLIHPEDTTLAREMPRLLREGQVGYQWRMRQPSGGWRTMHTSARVLGRRPDGGAEIVGYTVDITARCEAEKRAMAAARLASVGEMAAGLAHELKQPLQSISLAAEVAQLATRKGNAAEVDKRLERIVEQTQRTASLIESLRRFARGAEDATVSGAVPLARAVESALGLARIALRDASVSVEVALGDPAPVVRGQTVLLEQVLANLLLNARDALATRPAGTPRRIRITAGPGPEGVVRLTVADTGGGIAPEVMARLFEPFVTTKGPDKGTGLGLSICHGLIQAMGGNIEAQNDAEGAVFTITLPSAPAGEVPAT